MLGGNNRELGRGTHVYSFEYQCLLEVARVQAGVARATSSVGLRPNGLWWWQVQLDGIPAAVSARTFQRQRECRYNLAQFLANAPDAAAPRPGPEPGDHECPGRWQSHAAPTGLRR